MVYARVAFNINRDLGSTYDLITWTNGYHPLWMLLHLPFAAFSSSVLETMSTARMLWVTAAVACSYVWGRFALRISGNLTTQVLMELLIGVFGFFGWSLYVLYGGVETPMALLLLGLSLLGVERLNEEHGLRLTMGLAVCFALTFLCRLDFAIILLFPAAWSLLQIARVSLRKAFLFLCLGLAIPAPYLIWNYGNFGQLLPVSGIVKVSERIGPSWTLARLERFANSLSDVGLSPSLVGILLLIVGLAVLASTVLAVRSGKVRSATLWLLGVGVSVHYFCYLIIMDEVNVSWHVAPQMASVLLVCSLAGGSILENQTTTKRAMALFLFFGLLAWANAEFAEKKTWRRQAIGEELALGRWVSANIPMCERIVFYDGFFAAAVADHNIWIDANGLAGDLELARMARRNRTARIDDSTQPVDIADRMSADYEARWIQAGWRPRTGARVVYRSRRVYAKGWRELVLEARGAELGDNKPCRTASPAPALQRPNDPRHLPLSELIDDSPWYPFRRSLDLSDRLAV